MHLCVHCVVGALQIIVMMMMMTMMAGDVAETRRDSSADNRPVSVCSRYSDQRRLQPANDRVEPDYTGREAV